MAIIITVLLILGLSAFLYFKGTIVRAFAAVVSAILACIAAFAYFESLAGSLVSRGTMVTWAYPVAFLFLLIVTFAIFFTLTLLLTRRPVDFGFLPERIVRVICGIIAGFILSGAFLTAMVMAPLSNKSPYQRFDPSHPDIAKPGSSILNTDGFVTVLFGFASNGSLSGQRSFSALHPQFLDQVFLNRLNAGIPLITSSQAITIPAKTAIWSAPENLKDASGKPLSPKSGCKHMIVRIGINKNAAADAGTFAFSQLSLICREKAQARDPLAPGGTIIYPIGYLKAPGRVQTQPLTAQIKLESADFTAATKWLDFVFDVPENLTPVLVQFKQNNIAQLPPPTPADQAPLAEPYIPQSDCTAGVAKLKPVETAPVYGIELACDAKFLDGLSLQLKDATHFQSYQTDASVKPAVFEDDKITQAQAELVIKGEPNKPAEAAADATEETKTEKAPVPKQTKAKKVVPRRARVKKVVAAASPVGNMFKPIEGYKLLSLKCNKPATGAQLTGEQLPVLLELSGLSHYPVGVIAAGKVDDQTFYEIDYCSLPIIPDSNSGCLAVAENGAVEKPFPESVWLTEKAQSITEFYTLYMVKPTGNTIITGVKTADPNTAPAKFEKYEGFFVK